jgi:hypothetical protein
MTLPPQTSPDTIVHCEEDDYYFNEQFKRYAIQFMALFSELRVRVGVSAGLPPRLIRVPVIYGSRDRVVAWIKSEQTQNKPLRLPAMSVFRRSIAQAPDKKKGIGGTRRQTVARNNGQPFPENVGVVRQLMPIPYRVIYELSIFASNQLQYDQIMEQILILFDPSVQFQTSDDPMDWAQITTAELTSIQDNVNFPAGADRRIIQAVLNFEVIVYLQGPANFRENYIQNIKVRLSVVPTATDFSNSESIIQALDLENAEYIDLFTLSDIDIDKP